MAQEEEPGDNTQMVVRTWGKYPEIQKDFPYSDQCIAALIESARRNGVLDKTSSEFTSDLTSK